jgi:hypothetical protein
MADGKTRDFELMAASILLILSALNFFVNSVLIYHSQMFELHKLLKAF